MIQKGSAQAILDAAKTNKTVNSIVGQASKAGGICAIISISLTLGEVISAEPAARPRIIVGHEGGFAGSIAGAWSFAAIGAEFDPYDVITVPTLTLVGAVGGAWGGEKLGDIGYDAYVNE